MDEELPFNLLRELQTAGIANIIEDDWYDFCYKVRETEEMWYKKDEIVSNLIGRISLPISNLEASKK